jgi:hypothetical protein
VDELQARLTKQTEELVSTAKDPRKPDGVELTFKAFEELLLPMIFALARTVIMLFLAAAQEREAQRIPSRLEREGRVFRPAPAQARNIETWFGVVRYWRYGKVSSPPWPSESQTSWPATQTEER